MQAKEIQYLERQIQTAVYEKFQIALTTDIPLYLYLQLFSWEQEHFKILNSQKRNIYI